MKTKKTLPLGLGKIPHARNRDEKTKAVSKSLNCPEKNYGVHRQAFIVSCNNNLHSVTLDCDIVWPTQ